MGARRHCRFFPWSASPWIVFLCGWARSQTNVHATLTGSLMIWCTHQSSHVTTTCGHILRVVCTWDSPSIASILQSMSNSYSPRSPLHRSQTQSTPWSPSFVYIYGLLSTTIGVSWMFSPAVLGFITRKPFRLKVPLPLKSSRTL